MRLATDTFSKNGGWEARKLCLFQQAQATLPKYTRGRIAEL